MFVMTLALLLDAMLADLRLEKDKEYGYIADFARLITVVM